MGTKIPKMGMRPKRAHKAAAASGLADALFTRTQQRVLALLFGQPARAFGTLELIELARSGRGAVQRELQRLTDSGLIVATSVGQQRRYQANADAAIFPELQGLIAKTVGVPGILRSALAAHAPQIRLAILYGSVAKQADRADSDIDVLIVSDELGLEDVFEALEPAEAQLGRTVSPTLYTTKEFRERRRAGQPFLAKLLTSDHVVLMGSEDGIEAAR